MKTGLWYDTLSTDALSISAATTGNGTALPFNHCTQIIAFLEYTVADPPTSGVVEVEWAPTRDYAGKWSNIGSFTLANVVAGTADPGLTFPGALPFVRGRFSTEADKAVSLYLNGNIN